jgi:hypothetical protein
MVNRGVIYECQERLGSGSGKLTLRRPLRFKHWQNPAIHHHGLDLKSGSVGEARNAVRPSYPGFGHLDISNPLKLHLLSLGFSPPQLTCEAHDGQ